MTYHATAKLYFGSLAAQGAARVASITNHTVPATVDGDFVVLALKASSYHDALSQARQILFHVSKREWSAAWGDELDMGVGPTGRNISLKKHLRMPEEA
jgi:hypothetical protein